MLTYTRFGITKLIFFAYIKFQYAVFTYSFV